MWADFASLKIKAPQHIYLTGTEQAAQLCIRQVRRQPVAPRGEMLKMWQRTGFYWRRSLSCTVKDGSSCFPGRWRQAQAQAQQDMFRVTIWEASKSGLSCHLQHEPQGWALWFKGDKCGKTSRREDCQTGQNRRPNIYSRSFAGGGHTSDLRSCCSKVSCIMKVLFCRSHYFQQTQHFLKSQSSGCLFRCFFCFFVDVVSYTTQKLTNTGTLCMQQQCRWAVGRWCV